jgi:hypothetical protein
LEKTDKILNLERMFAFIFPCTIGRKLLLLCTLTTLGWLMGIRGLSAQDFLKYDVLLFGKKIGSTVVQREADSKGMTRYQLNHRSEINLLFTKKKSALDFNVTYLHQQLINSSVESIKDGVREMVNVVKDGSKYVIENGLKKSLVNGVIDFSAIHLYFSEPGNRTSIFSERLGEFCTFRKSKDGSYVCELENGVLNIYRYRDGVLNELEMSSRLGTIFLKLAEKK